MGVFPGGTTGRAGPSPRGLLAEDRSPVGAHIRRLPECLGGQARAAEILRFVFRRGLLLSVKLATSCFPGPTADPSGPPQASHPGRGLTNLKVLVSPSPPEQKALGGDPEGLASFPAAPQGAQRCV